MAVDTRDLFIFDCMLSAGDAWLIAPLAAGYPKADAAAPAGLYCPGIFFAVVLIITFFCAGNGPFFSSSAAA